MKLKRENFKRWKKKEKKVFGSIFLLRPLIETTRFDLKKLCQIWRLPIYPDVTNQNLISTRNRIRLQLLPILRFFFNPQIDTIFAQFAQISLQEQDYLNYLTTRLIKDLFSKKKNLQKKMLNPFEDFSHRQTLYFCKVKTKKRGVKLRKTQFYQGNKFCETSRFLLCKDVSKKDGYFVNAKQRKLNFCQTKVTFYKNANSPFLLRSQGIENADFRRSRKQGIEDALRLRRQGFPSENSVFAEQKLRLGRNQVSRSKTSFHVLYKFEFQNQALFFIPLAIQKRIGKKLIEYFLNKKVNFFHVEYIMKYLKNSQNKI